MEEPMVKEGIEYWGICETIPENIKAFKAETFNKVFTLDEDLPEIDEVCKVKASSCIDYFKVVETATGNSVDGQILTGWKLMIHGEIKFQVHYSSFKKGLSIFVIREALNFDTFITLSSNTLLISKIYPEVFIEDLSVINLDKKNFFLTAHLILMAYSH